tara:strand:+ start:398 stop:817 length:420 start_codon:yes stop_codon:yes gene_type:complete
MIIPKVTRKIEEVFVHCSDTKTNQSFGVDDFRKWHVQERGWSDVGYHYVIRLNGTVEIGRPLARSGAHAKGHNAHSVGICFEGGKKPSGSPWEEPTAKQVSAWFTLYWRLCDVYGNLKIRGHYEVSSKTCPNFNVEILK